MISNEFSSFSSFGTASSSSTAQKLVSISTLAPDETWSTYVVLRFICHFCVFPTATVRVVFGYGET